MLDSIEEIARKIKGVAGLVGRTDIFLALLIVLVGFVSFGLGRLSALEGAKPPIVLEQTTSVFDAGNPLSGDTQTEQGISTGRYVASISGTKYHFPWCPSAGRIKEENKIWFDTKEEAEAAGYTPAANCEGL